MKSLRWKLLLLVMVGVWVGTGRVMFAAPFPDDCAEVCGSSTQCNTQCYPDELAFINGNSITCYIWGDYESPCCGDDQCTGGETAGSCFADCHCGDDVCNSGETVYTCPSDCEAGDPPGGGSTCGDDECTGSEDCDSCPRDCGNDCGYCGDQVCAANEYGGAGSGNTPACSVTTQLWCYYCPQDCGGCNQNYCDGKVCEDQYGRCKSCTADSQCLYSDQYCRFDGLCATLACDVNTPCPANQGLSCANGYCKKAT